ncbi:nitroreductase family protein [Listeria aquatica]
MMRENNNFEEILTGRRSVRVYDENVKISKQEMKQILEETVLAPSSVNMQPWRFVVVESDEAKKKLRPLIRFNTRQNDTSAAMILIFGDLECYAYGEEIYNQAFQAGKMPEQIKNEQLETIIPLYESLNKQEMGRIVTIDGSLAAMQLMLVARSYGYDTNPIGGFEQDQLAEAFGMDKERYLPVMILSIGKTKEPGFESVRLPVDKIAEWK